MTEDQKKNFETQLWGIANHGTNIQYRCFNKLSTLCPKLKTKIANFLSSLDKILNKLTKQIEKATEFKKACCRGCLFDIKEKIIIINNTIHEESK